MNSLVIEITNHCNFSCKHCSRDKAGERIHMPLEMFQEVAEQAVSLGIRDICITGGEVLLYPWLEEAIDIISYNDMGLSIVTNAYLFKERLLGILEKNKNIDVCISLDGANESQHDFFRNKDGSFMAAIEALALCNQLGVDVSLKMAVWSGVKDSILRMATLGLSYSSQVGLIILTPTPNLIREGLIPSPQEYEDIINNIKRRIMPALPGVDIEGICDRSTPVPLCNPFYSGLNIDYKGDMVFCCNLSNVTGKRKENSFYIGNIKDMDLDQAFVKHMRLCSKFITGMIEKPASIWERSCFFCMARFGLMEWLKDLESPWRELLWTNPPS